MIVGLENVTEGEIRVAGQRVNEVDPKDRNMAMVFQSYAIYPHLTVRENMAFPLKLARLPRDEIARRVEQAADLLELGAVLERKPRSLSGGQRQRVAMGRALQYCGAANYNRSAPRASSTNSRATCSWPASSARRR
jgi:multiple sugar transport system ATP-binding protein